MKSGIIMTAAFCLLLASPAVAQQTPASLVAAYDALANTILSLHETEASYVRALLDGHFHAAKVLAARGDWEAVAAEMAIFANEGDNAVGGVRKRLLEGGHHFNAEGEEQGVFEPGYVIVTKEAKVKMLNASTALRRASTEEARKKAWEEFVAVARKLLHSE